jgi:hypothetical protein
MKTLWYKNNIENGIVQHSVLTAADDKAHSASQTALFLVGNCNKEYTSVHREE